MTARPASTPRSSRSTAVGHPRVRGPVRVIPTGAGMCATEIDRDEEDHKGRKRSKVAWALEATIVTMARRPGAAPRHPNLAVGLVLARPGEDPGGVGVRVLASLSSRGYKPGFLGVDHRLHPGPARALPPAGASHRLPDRHGLQGTRPRPPGQLRRGGARRRVLLLPGHARSARVGERGPPGGDDRRGDVRRPRHGARFLPPRAQVRAGPRRLRTPLLPGRRRPPARRLPPPAPRRTSAATVKSAATDTAVVHAARALGESFVVEEGSLLSVTHGALGRIRTCAPGSGGRCSIP